MLSRIRRILSALGREKSGNAALMVAVGLPALVGASGLAVDTSQWYMWKREMQFAVDQGALAGAWARTDASTKDTYSTRATQEYNASLQVTKAFATNTPTVALVNYGAGVANAVKVDATGGKRLPFSGLLVDWAAQIKVSATATVKSGATYTGCIVALHSTAKGAFTLGGDASGNATCGAVALSRHADAAMVKNGNSTAQLGQLVAAGGIDAGFSANGTMHPNTAGLHDPFEGLEQPNPSPSPARTYSCPAYLAPSTVTKATKTVSSVTTYVYYLGNNSNQALNNANNGTNATTWSPIKAGSTNNGTPQNDVIVPTGTVAGSTSQTGYTYVQQVQNSPKKHEIKKVVTTTTYSNVVVVNDPGNDGIARPEPGTYGTISIACTTDFQPGIFVVDDIDFGQSHVVTGSGVLFVIKNAGGMHINSNSNITLSGITKEMLTDFYNYDEDDAGMLSSMVIYDKDTTAQLKINGNSDVHLFGTLYMPKREVWLNGTATATGECMMVVASQVTFTGTIDLDNFCIPPDTDAPQVGGADSEVKLVA